MPYDRTRDPYADRGLGREHLGPWGASITLGTADVDLAVYGYVRVFAPATLADPVLRLVPARNADDASVDMPLVAGLSDLVPMQVRRILGSANGSTAGLRLLLIYPAPPS